MDGFAARWRGFVNPMAFTWSWSLPARMLVPLVLRALRGRPHEEVQMLHARKLCAQAFGNVRGDGLANPRLIEELGQTCGFEEGECVCCWAGCFPHYFTDANPEMSWRIVDAKAGELHRGHVRLLTLQAATSRPSDAKKSSLLLGARKLRPIAASPLKRDRASCLRF